MAVKKKAKSKITLTTISPNSSTYSSAGMKFRPNTETTRENSKGKLPCAEAASVQQIIFMMVVHLCRKIIYGLDVSYRIGFYILGTLLISVVSDYKSSAASKSYFAKSDNFLNQWFVKFGWFWTLLLLGLFNFFTARSYGCGNMNVLRNAATRLSLASVIWYSLTCFFEVVEYKSGICEIVRHTSKETCEASGHLWKGFDISGHCFLLIFSNLVIIEEGKAYLGWEKIRDYLRNEHHKRVNDLKEGSSDTPLSKLKNEEYIWLRKHYPSDTYYVRLLFCLLAPLTLLWDIMLLATLFFYHMMIEKVVASGIAVLMWFLVYKFICVQPFSPGLPGEGPFKYVTWRDPEKCKRPLRSASMRQPETSSKWNSKDEIPKFMGMPLYALKDFKEEKVAADNNINDADGSAGGDMKKGGRSFSRGRQGSIADLATMRPLGRARSRSQSRTRLTSSKNSLNIKF